MEEKKPHFVLVHGSCHGAWCWFKLASLLRKAGHEVSVIDLKASGIHPAMPDQVVSVADYSQPLLDLLDSIAADERVVLVGHSFGGFSIALAADKFPAKVSVAVFLAAFMPHPSISPSHILHNYFVEKGGVDSEQISTDDHSKPTIPTTIQFDAELMRSRFYNNCSYEDYTLATCLVRAAPFYRDELSKHDFVSEGNYGRTKRAYAVCKDDQAIKESFQRWMIEMSPVDEVVEIEGADHMVMLSKPLELFSHLLKIAESFD
ncbi:methyl jasmonate esterase 1-like isoform X2 [Nymphaea colorata]|nr:methyl jasmonate esterase 1-like isoform X2 [Nymphaea colorata]